MAQWASMLGVWSKRVEAVLAASTRALREISSGTVAIAALAAVGLVWGLYQAARAVPRDENTQRRLRVLITGGTRGLGAAMARKFAALGDDVAVAARRKAPLSIPTVFSNQKIVALQCDITRPSEVEELGLQVVRDLGSVDLWINNAGASQSAKEPLWRTPVKDINAVLSTNAGSIVYGSRMALRVLQNNELGGALVNIDGAGSSGMTTPHFATYGYTKAGVPQLAATLNAELQRAAAGSLSHSSKAALQRIGVHTASPGMVVTDLLMGGVDFSSQGCKTRRVFNILAESPDTVAAWLVPRLRGLVTSNRRYVAGSAEDMEVELTGPPRRGEYLRYLTPAGVVWRFASSLFWSTRGRLVPESKPGSTSGKSEHAKQQ